MINNARAKMGRIKHWYGGKKGYGFVRPEDGGEAVFVHHTCMTPHAGPE
ncbi:MAG TPA: cold shock domain-containing protein, partial [Chloroflexia bacterium]|nr:cold shock domain-containing protein [Chloroflexia bacterium]